MKLYMFPDMDILHHRAEYYGLHANDEQTNVLDLAFQYERHYIDQFILSEFRLQ